MILDIINKKRLGQELTTEEIKFFVKGVTDYTLPDYQVSALLMAIAINGMNDREITDLTLAMTHSGDVLEHPYDNTVDKHSSGGVGDTTSLAVVPILTCFDFTVVKMTGRGLGFTGGTIDKLESIPGFNISLTEEQVKEQLERLHAIIVGQTAQLAPADKRLYALRDVTGTIQSIPLIASSIMSKKLACGAKNIVLDVKVGNCAFMKDVESATELAKQMVKIGKLSGVNTMALITDMNYPLGNNVGCKFEVEEAIGTLKGDNTPLAFITKELCRVLLESHGVENALEKIEEVISNGKAYEMFKEIISSQGGNLEEFEKIENYPCKNIFAKEDGVIEYIDGVGLAELINDLGGGRKELGDEIDHRVGAISKVRVGDKVEKGQLLIEVYANKPIDEEKFVNCFKVGEKAPKVELIKGIIR